MAAELIVDFPLTPKRNHGVVKFAETSELYIYIVDIDRHEDKNELWYTKAEYKAMKRNIKRDVLQARASDWTSEEDEGSWIGIAHLLTRTCGLEMQACRRRCVRAVLAEQASQDKDGSFRPEDIALASFAETKRAVLRARKLGRLHQDCIEKYCSQSSL